MRRTVATLLVVTSPLLLAVPVGAREGRIAGPTGTPTPAAATPAPATHAVPALSAAPPAVPALAATPAVAVAPARTVTAAVRPVVRTLRAKTPAPAVLDAAYEAQLRADLCQARAIFCGLDRGGRYPAG